MSKQITIAPSTLSANMGDLAGDILSVSQAGADWIHVDVMDGSFVPPITFGANVVAVAKANCSLFLDVHLMIVNPEKHIEEFSRAGSNRIIVHLEACSDPRKVLESIRNQGILNGLAVSPPTPIEKAFDCLDVCDMVLVMTVNPGWGGQKFIAESPAKIERLCAEMNRRGLKFPIEVDGGINPQTAKECVRAGASVLVAGSYVFSSKDRAAAIKSLRV